MLCGEEDPNGSAKTTAWSDNVRNTAADLFFRISYFLSLMR